MKEGFTLIELVMVIVILGILAAIVLPRFIGVNTKAIESQEDAIIASLKEAAMHQYLRNQMDGSIPADQKWPSDIPFTWLDSPPPYQNWVAGGDGVHWQYYKHEPGGAYMIYCPHYNSTRWEVGLADGTKGIHLTYKYNDIAWRDQTPGQWTVWFDWGH